MKILIVAENRHNSLGGIELYNNQLIDIFHKHKHQIYEYAFNLNPERIDLFKHNDKVTPLNKMNRSNCSLTMREKRIKMKIAVKEIQKIYNDFDVIINCTNNVAWPKEIYESPKWIYVQHYNADFYKQYFIIGKFFSPVIYFGMHLFGIKNPFNYFKNIVFYSQKEKNGFKNRNLKNAGFIFVARFNKKEILNFKKNFLFEKRKSFIYYGRIDNAQKNIKLVKNIFDKSEKQIDLYGSGDQKLMVDTKYCKFYGSFEKEKLIDLLKKYKFSILFSKYEGFSFAVAESISLGLVPISTQNPVSQYFSSNNLGFVVNKKNVFETLDRCSQITKNEYLKYSNNCFDFAINNLTKEEFEKKWIAFTDKVYKQTKNKTANKVYS